MQFDEFLVKYSNNSLLLNKFLMQIGLVAV